MPLFFQYCLPLQRGVDVFPFKLRIYLSTSAACFRAHVSFPCDPCRFFPNTQKLHSPNTVRYLPCELGPLAAGFRAEAPFISATTGHPELQRGYFLALEARQIKNQYLLQIHREAVLFITASLSVIESLWRNLIPTLELNDACSSVTASKHLTSKLFFSWAKNLNYCSYLVFSNSAWTCPS